MTSVFVDLEKLKVPHSGLGQFCLHVGAELAHRRGWDVVEWRERNRPGEQADLADEWGSWGG